jgi:drug/metabolite transporter (DMT)-like permease
MPGDRLLSERVPVVTPRWANESTVGRLLALGSGISFGTVGLFSKLFYAHGGGAFELVTIRLAGTALLLGVVVAARRRLLACRNLRLIGLALGLGVFQAGTNYSLLEGYSHAPAALIVLLYYIYPLLVTIGASFIFGEEFSRRQAAAVTLGLAGIALTVGRPHSAPLVGVLLGLVAGACAAAFVLGARHAMSDGSLAPVETLALMLVGPGIGFTIASAVCGFATPSAGASVYALGLVLVGTALAPLLFFSAVPKIGAGTTSLLASVEPFVTVVLAYVILHESLSALQVCGGILVLSAVASLSLPLGRKRLGAPAAAAETLASTGVRPG